MRKIHPVIAFSHTRNITNSAHMFHLYKLILQGNLNKLKIKIFFVAICTVIKKILHVLDLFNHFKFLLPFTQQHCTVAVYVLFCNHMPALARGQSVILWTGDWRLNSVCICVVVDVGNGVDKWILMLFPTQPLTHGQKSPLAEREKEAEKDERKEREHK